MGQYYEVALIRGNKIIPVKNTCGLKLMEHACYDNEFVDAIMYDLAINGPARVAWVGDYSDEYYGDGDLYETKIEREKFLRIWNKVWKREDNKHLVVLKSEWDSEEEKLSFRYLVNHSLKQYIDLLAYRRLNTQEDKYGEWCVHPLPLLTACGNGRGGGDYHENNPGYMDVGAWAVDLLDVIKDVPEGYEDVTETYCFKESI